MDLEEVTRVMVDAKYKNRGVTMELGHTVYGGRTNELEDYWSGPKLDFMGEEFAPFNHNYLYGWKMSTLLENVFRSLNEDENARKTMHAELTKMVEKFGRPIDTLETTDYLNYVLQGGHHMVMLYRAFDFAVTPFEESVFILNRWFGLQAKELTMGNDYTRWMFPLFTVGQLYALGWRRTLWLWVAGVLISEGANVQIGYPFSGWSIILYMIYGQFWSETFSERRLRTLKGGIQSLDGLAINGIGGYGAYQTLKNLYYDPAPFMQKSQKTGRHHGAHHFGLIAGFLLNRWTR